MADDREEILRQQIAALEEQTNVLAEKVESLVGVDCSFGACIFDPEMEDIEARIAVVQKRKATLEKIISDLESCET